MYVCCLSCSIVSSFGSEIWMHVGHEIKHTQPLQVLESLILNSFVFFPLSILLLVFSGSFQLFSSFLSTNPFSIALFCLVMYLISPYASSLFFVYSSELVIFKMKLLTYLLELLSMYYFSVLLQLHSTLLFSFTFLE